MIKVIAFDLVGVLVTEKDIDLTEQEDKIERLFGPNKSDSDFLNNANNIINNESILIETTKEIINKLYQIRENGLFERIKGVYPDIKIIIATNHVSYIRKYIEENFEKRYLDDLIISAEINRIKPNKDFYQYVLNKMNISPNELLFLDDNVENIECASEVGINTIRVYKDTDLFDEICKLLGDNY